MTTYRITDDGRVDTYSPGCPPVELVMDLELDEDDDEPVVDEDQATEILDWWADTPLRAWEPHETDDTHLILVNVDAEHGPMIGTWCHEMDDETWPLSGFPFTSLHYEEVTEDELDTSSSGSRQHYIETGRYLTHAEVAEFQALNP